MINIPLQAIPNQSFSIRLDNNVYDMSFKEADRIMACTIAINNNLIITNNRIVSGFPIINYDYLQNGNFVILTNNEEYPYYTQFGITQYLIYASQTEIDQLNAGI